MTKMSSTARPSSRQSQDALPDARAGTAPPRTTRTTRSQSREPPAQTIRASSVDSDGVSVGKKNGGRKGRKTRQARRECSHTLTLPALRRVARDISNVTSSVESKTLLLVVHAFDSTWPALEIPAPRLIVALVTEPRARTIMADKHSRARYSRRGRVR